MFELFFYVVFIHDLGQLFLEGSYALVHKAAGMDVIEIIQVGIDIEGKAVHGNKMRAP